MYSSIAAVVCARLRFMATPCATGAVSSVAVDTPGVNGFKASRMCLRACPAQVGLLPGPPAKVKKDFVNAQAELALFAVVCGPGGTMPLENEVSELDSSSLCSGAFSHVPVLAFHSRQIPLTSQSLSPL